MLLYEHEDFEDAISKAEDHFQEQGLRSEVIEKDYYVTLALRLLKQQFENNLIFKGGTSLSKGWDLINRFSEDIDLLVDPQYLGESPTRGNIDSKLRKVRDFISENAPLKYVKKEGTTRGGRSRKDTFVYSQLFNITGEIEGSILVETNIAGGNEPSTKRELNSYLGKFITESGSTLICDDEEPFSFRLLHFRRTFIEKLFTIHKHVELFLEDNEPIGPHARHYYDLFHLAGKEEVKKMLQSEEYGHIKSEYRKIASEYYPDHYREPKDMKFSNSKALFPQAKLQEIIKREYERQCRNLCYSPPPSWDEVQKRFEELKSIL